MVGASRRSADRAARVWGPLGQVAEALAGWSVPPGTLGLQAPDARRRGRRGPPLHLDTEAALLNAVAYASLLPERSSLHADEVPYLVPVFAPVRPEGDAAGRGRAGAVLPLEVSVDGVPLGRLGRLPTIRPRRARQTVELRLRSTGRRRLEEGVVTCSVGFGRGPLPAACWGDGGTARRAILDPDEPTPAGVPSWVAGLRFEWDLPVPSRRELSLCYGVTSALAERAMVRLLAQLRPLVATHARHHRSVEGTLRRSGGTPCDLDDRSSDLYECVIHHIQAYVAKVIAEDGAYARDLFGYVSSCLKPSAFRAQLPYEPRTGRQDVRGVSDGVAERSARLRRHALMHRLDDPAQAQAHHAVHWVLARHFREELRSGVLVLADLEAMWEARRLPEGVRVPTLSEWQAAIGHHMEHVSLEAPVDGDRRTTVVEISDGDERGLPGEAPYGRALRISDDDLDLLTTPSDGFSELTARVARRLSEEEPSLWERVTREGKAAAVVVRLTLEPFSHGRTRREAAAALYERCTVDGRWLRGDELLEAWLEGPVAEPVPLVRRPLARRAPDGRGLTA